VITRVREGRVIGNRAGEKRLDDDDKVRKTRQAEEGSMNTYRSSDDNIFSPEYTQIGMHYNTAMPLAYMFNLLR